LLRSIAISCDAFGECDGCDAVIEGKQYEEWDDRHDCDANDAQYMSRTTYKRDNCDECNDIDTRDDIDARDERDNKINVTIMTDDY
jgi:hypothetical protein